MIGQVTVGSKAELLGLKLGDIIVATSATAGDQMWYIYVCIYIDQMWYI
jgi:hypothetical protein